MLTDHVLTNGEAIAMLLIAAVLMVGVLWPVLLELRTIRRNRRAHREHVAYVARRAQFARESEERS